MHFPGWLPHKASPIHFHKIFPIFLISSWAEHKQIPTICISWRLVQAGPLCVECWGRRLTRLAGWVRTPGPRCNCGCHHHGAPSLPSPNTATTHTLLHCQTYNTNEFLNGWKVFMNNCINLIDFFHILNWPKTWGIFSHVPLTVIHLFDKYFHIQQSLNGIQILAHSSPHFSEA